MIILFSNLVVDIGLEFDVGLALQALALEYLQQLTGAVGDLERFGVDLVAL